MTNNTTSELTLPGTNATEAQTSNTHAIEPTVNAFRFNKPTTNTEGTNRNQRRSAGFTAKAIAAFGLTVAGLAGTISPAIAASYPYPNAPDCNEYGPGGCVADQWNFYQGQCTSWVAWKLNTVNGVAFTNRYRGAAFGNASTWDEAARSLGIPVNSTPARGAVAQWNSRNHVAYVEKVNADGSIVLSDQNSDLHNGIRTGFAVRRGDAWWPENFIHIKDLPTAAAPQPVSSMPIGTTRTVDDPRITGPGSWLTRRTNTSHGHSRDYVVTQSGAGRAVTNVGHWTFRNIPNNAVVRVQAYVPTREAVANVVYQAYDGGQREKSKTINQQAHYGWVTLFYVRVNNGTLTIKLPDNLGGSDQYGRLIGYDAVRITRTS